MATACPHCAAPTDSAASFCTSCGKAVPTQNPSGPRILGEHEVASSSAGTTLMIDELAKTTKKAFGALLAVGILQALFATAFTIMTARSAGTTPAVITGVILGGISVLFLSLSVWARKSPLPAAIVGLVVYGTLLTIDGIVGVLAGHPEVIIQGALVKLVIISCLVHAISSGVKHRALVRTQANARPGTAETLAKAA
jgi:hypothetical protein